MKILVSGGGIAGLAAALFLHRAGHDVGVIDRAPSFQRRGYAITVKSFGLRLLEELGLRAALEQHELDFEALRVNDAQGRHVQTFSRAITQQMTHGQILTYRSDVHSVLYEAARELVPIRFGVHVGALERGAHEGATSVRVALSDGTHEDADLLVVAEGVRSETRRLVFGDECVRSFDVVYAAATIAVDHGLDPRDAHAYAGRHQNVAFLPIDAHRLLVQCYFRGAHPHGRPRDALLETFGAFPPEVRRIFEAVRDEDVFCDTIAMIALPSLSRGRVVILGDAGYCPTFLSGMGASLGILGAKMLARSLDTSEGLARYDATMRPLVDHFQANALANVEDALPASALREVARNWVMHLLPPSLLARHFGKQFDVEDRLLAGAMTA